MGLFRTGSYVYGSGMKPTPGSLGERVAAEIRAERARQSMTIGDLAKRSGVGVRSMPRYLSGERELDVQRFADICRALGVSVSDMLARAAANPSSENGTARRSG